MKDKMKMDHDKMDHSMNNMNHSQMDHSMHNMDHGKMDHSMHNMDHSQMDHTMHDMDHSQMDHSMHNMDHGKMDHSMHGGMQMNGMGHMGNLKLKMIVALILGLPVLFLSPMMGIKFPFQFSFPGSDWVVLIFSTIVFLYGGYPFIMGAGEEIKAKKPEMMTLISMGISVAYIYSLYAFVNNTILHRMPMVMDFFFELVSLIIIMLIGHYIEMQSMMKAGSALEDLNKLLPEKAHVLGANQQVTDEPVGQLKIGDKILVKAGESIPADGKIISGTSHINEALVTGESKEVSKTVADTVIGGSVNGEGTLTIEVTAEAGKGFLAQVSNLVMNAQSSKSKIENVAGKVAGWLFYAAVSIGLVAFLIWLPLAGLSKAASILVTVLVIACPHALGLAIPLVVTRSTTLGAKNGVLIKNRDSIEEAKNINYVLMDKTGTLTEGVFAVNTLKSLAPEKSDAEVTALMGGLETNSSHPIAKSIVDYAKKQNVTLVDFADAKTIAGVGITGVAQNDNYEIVDKKYLVSQKINFQQSDYEELANQGLSVSFLLENNQVIGIVGVGDQLKPHSKELVQDLLAKKIVPVMLTGDNQETAAIVAKNLGITKFHAELLPGDKQKIVKQYQAENDHVIMVGDGVNDAPSLAQANIGIAIGAGTDVAIDAADVVLVRSDPLDIINFLNLAEATDKKMIENLWWGAGYNIVALPLAAGILAPLGFILNPAVGAILMSLSTVIVAINAMSLKFKKV